MFTVRNTVGLISRTIQYSKTVAPTFSTSCPLYCLVGPLKCRVVHLPGTPAGVVAGGAGFALWVLDACGSCGLKLLSHLLANVLLLTKNNSKYIFLRNSGKAPVRFTSRVRLPYVLQGFLGYKRPLFTQEPTLMHRTVFDLILKPPGYKNQF